MSTKTLAAVLFVTVLSPFIANAASEMTVAGIFAQTDKCKSGVAMDATNKITMDEFQLCAEVAPELNMTIQQLAAQHPVYVTGHVTGLLQWKKFVISSFQLGR